MMGDGYGEWSEFYYLDVRSKEGRIGMPIRCVVGGLIAESGEGCELHALDDKANFRYHTQLEKRGEFFVCNVPTPDLSAGCFATQEIYLRKEKDGKPSARRVASRNKGLKVYLVHSDEKLADTYYQLFGSVYMEAH